jgi:hypothetical protein
MAGDNKEKTMPDMTTNIGQPDGAQYIAPDAHGQNFYTIDRQFQDLLSLYMEPGLLKQMTPHFERLGELAGNRLDDLAMTAPDSDQATPACRWRQEPTRAIHPRNPALRFRSGTTAQAKPGSHPAHGGWQVRSADSLNEP